MKKYGIISLLLAFLVAAPTLLHAQIIKGEAANTDKAALGCDMLVLAIIAWDQIRYGMNMLYLIPAEKPLSSLFFLFCSL